MDMLTLILIAIGLSMDSFAVSVSNGLTIKDLKFGYAVIIALFLSIFQGLTPALGWLIGIKIEHFITDYDHWIAFLILGFIGLKMIVEGIRSDDKQHILKLSITVLLAQSIATSIDAFVIGIGFAVLKIGIVTPIIIIGTTTFLFSMIGLRIGKFLGYKVGKAATIIGGIVLIGIGTRILIEHIFIS